MTYYPTAKDDTLEKLEASNIALIADGSALLKALERLLPSEAAISHAAIEWRAAYDAAAKLNRTIRGIK